MKSAMTSLLVVLTSTLPLLADRTVDLSKAEQRPFTQFIKYVQWPSGEQLARLSISKDGLAADLDSFRSLLKARLRGKYLPRGVDFDSNVIACTNLFRGSDHLLLQYSATGGVTIQVYEATALYVLIQDPRSREVPLSDVADYVKAMASDFLLLPKDPEEARADLSVFVSSADIGESKCGTLGYGSKGFPPEHWYSSLKWWSDGRRVLFALIRSDTPWVSKLPARVEKGGPRRLVKREDHGFDAGSADTK